MRDMKITCDKCKAPARFRTVSSITREIIFVCEWNHATYRLSWALQREMAFDAGTHMEIRKQIAAEIPT